MDKTYSRVPKVIHQIIGLRTIPLIDRCIKSWKILESMGFTIKTWNDGLIAEFLLESHPFAHAAFVNARNHAEAADIARYLIIYTFGGYFVDWDIELLDCEKFLTISDQNPDGYMLVDESNGTLASEYFCSKKNDKFLLNLTKDIVTLYLNGRRSFLQTPQYSGPFRMRDSLITHPETFMACIPVKEVFAYDYSEIRNPPLDEITQPLIHYWAHSWIK
jgi:mannosyltransferase OCH1-like enzyme